MFLKLIILLLGLNTI